MADLPNVFVEAGKGVSSVAGVGALIYFATQLIRGWVTGSSQTDRQSRDEQRADVATLRLEMDKTRLEVDALRDEVRRLNSAYLYMLSTRAEARIALLLLERGMSHPETVWPPDPTDLLTR